MEKKSKGSAAKIVIVLRNEKENAASIPGIDKKQEKNAAKTL
jgi:hypothetical protein